MFNKENKKIIFINIRTLLFQIITVNYQNKDTNLPQQQQQKQERNNNKNKQYIYTLNTCILNKLYGII